MAKPARAPRAGMSYVVAATEERRAIFEISRVAELFVETLLHYRVSGHYKLHAYVVLPDRVHLLLTPQGITLDQAMGLIRRGFTHRLESQIPIWQEGIAAYSIANIHDLERVRALLHQLPVREGLAPAAEMYPYSSAYRQAGADAAAGVAAVAAKSSGRKEAPATATSLRKVAS
jgi:putative transposase